jgi:hypothetical protein
MIECTLYPYWVEIAGTSSQSSATNTAQEMDHMWVSIYPVSGNIQSR